MRQTEIGVASEEALDGVVEESDEGKFIQGLDMDRVLLELQANELWVAKFTFM